MGQFAVAALSERRPALSGIENSRPASETAATKTKLTHHQESRVSSDSISRGLSFRVSMGLRPTHRNESQPFVTPAQSLP